MLNVMRYKVVLIEILKRIYDDPELRTVMGFKGGTAAMLFYDLPRFSVDLDFDLLVESKKELVFEKLSILLSKQGVLRQAIEKRYTLFFLISYEKGEHVIKVEVTKRPIVCEFEPQNYLGLTMLVMKPSDMVASKISAFLTRRKLAMRDVFDVWFFLKNQWQINERVLLDKTGLTIDQALKEAIGKVDSLDRRQVLQGLGELLDVKQKDWVRSKLLEETAFYLRLYEERLLVG